MLISMNWINDFVDLSGLDLEKLIHQFTLSTAEVEDIYHMGGDIETLSSRASFPSKTIRIRKSCTC
jgi:phenylalanyl-tRNA synthetase beta chain